MLGHRLVEQRVDRRARPPFGACTASGAKRSGRRRPPTRPATPAPSTMNGNGAPKKKIAHERQRREPTMVPFFSARFPMRITASMTMASTAALSPKNSPSRA